MMQMGMKEIYQFYNDYLLNLQDAMLLEVEHWEWNLIPEMKTRVLDSLRRPGKRLRPLLLFLFSHKYSGNPEKSICVAAAVETYHTATLIYDDIQDNSEFRRGLPTPYVTGSTSMAMNQAGVIRSLMYHIVHRCEALSLSERNEVHRAIDKAATLVSLGQIIDIAWNEGWYKSYKDFPYKKMIEWKTASLFECSSYLGGYLAGAPVNHLPNIKLWGNNFGILFQMVDDYQDIFGNPAVKGRPPYEDLRAGKMTLPVIYLLDELSNHGRETVVVKILDDLSERDIERFEWDMLINLLYEYKIDKKIHSELQQRALALEMLIDRLGADSSEDEEVKERLKSVVRALISKVKA